MRKFYEQYVTKRDINKFLKTHKAREISWGQFIQLVGKEKPMDELYAYGSKKIVGTYDSWTLYIYNNAAKYTTELARDLGKKTEVFYELMVPYEEDNDIVESYKKSNRFKEHYMRKRRFKEEDEIDIINDTDAVENDDHLEIEGEIAGKEIDIEIPLDHDNIKLSLDDIEDILDQAEDEEDEEDVVDEEELSESMRTGILRRGSFRRRIK